MYDDKWGHLQATILRDWKYMFITVNMQVEPSPPRHQTTPYYSYISFSTCIKKKKNNVIVFIIS